MESKGRRISKVILDYIMNSKLAELQKNPVFKETPSTSPPLEKALTLFKVREQAEKL